LETGNDLVAEPLQYSSDFGHSFKMKISEISLYFNGLRFHLSILPKNNYLPLCCYTGVAYCDMVALNREHLFTDDEGALWLKFRRQKTNTLCRVKLLSEAVRMIERYQSEERNTLFAPITYSAYLVQLKALQLRAGISIPLSAHVGRHTFATLITLERGVPIETVSRMLGHSNIQTTERYAHVTPKKLFDEFGRFLSFTENLTLTL
jgi:site-specific recombinase XerD